jgi:hypothetical protein
MSIRMQWNKIDWWFWAATLVFILLAVTGWDRAYHMVIIISALQVLYFSIKQKSLVSFDVQVRVVYFAFTLAGLSALLRFPFYLFLLIGTAMVVFLGRCGIALALRKMPWNRDRMYCTLERGEEEHRDR